MGDKYDQKYFQTTGGAKSYWKKKTILSALKNNWVWRQNLILGAKIIYYTDLGWQNWPKNFTIDMGDQDVSKNKYFFSFKHKWVWRQSSIPGAKIVYYTELGGQNRQKFFTNDRRAKWYQKKTIFSALKNMLVRCLF